jgi:hypothetical protein
VYIILSKSPLSATPIIGFINNTPIKKAATINTTTISNLNVLFFIMYQPFYISFLLAKNILQYLKLMKMSIAK